MSTPNEKLGGVPLVKYFDLGKKAGMPGWIGRGGVIRLLLLSVDAKYEDEVVTFDADWPNKKAALVSSGENPGGTLPVVKVGDKWFTESYAILRRFARQLGFYGADVERDYAADVVADSILSFRGDAVASVLGDDAVKVAFKAKRPGYYQLLESLVGRFGGGANGHVAAGEGPTYADFLLYAILHDDSVVYGREPLDASAHLKAFYDKFEATQDACAEWCAKAL